MGLINIASGNSTWRGLDYYKENKVSDYKKISDSKYEGIVNGSNGKKYRLQNISLESNLKTTEKDVYTGKHLTWSIHNVSKEFALLSAAAATMFTLLSNRERKEMVTMTSSQIDYLVRTAREKFENESEFQRAVTTITNKSIDEELTASETLKHDLISQNITVEDINSLGGFSK